MTSDRRFNEEETALILERAAAAESARAEGGTSVTRRGQGQGSAGMTLAQLEEIATEVGLRPEDIRAAAQAMDRGDMVRTERTTTMGLPVGVSRTVPLARDMTDLEWERLVVVLRETFQARGTVRREGSLREWSNGNLHALVEPTATGFRLRMSTKKGSALSNVLFGGVILLTGLSLMVDSSGFTLRVGMASIMSMVGAGTLAYSMLALPKWAGTRAAQMESVAREANAILESGDLSAPGGTGHL